MTNHQSEETTQVVSAEPASFSQRIAGWIEDPFGSAILATVATTTAVGFVLSGMLIVNFAIS